MGLSWIIVLGLILIVIFNLWLGYQKGLIYELAFLLSLIITIFLMQKIIFPMAQNFQHMISFIALSFIISWLIIKYLLKKIKIINNIAVIGFVNKVLGMVIGMLKAVIISGLLMLVIYSPLVDNGKTMIVTNPILNQVNDQFKMHVPFYDKVEKVVDVTKMIKQKEVI